MAASHLVPLDPSILTMPSSLSTVPIIGLPHAADCAASNPVAGLPWRELENDHSLFRPNPQAEDLPGHTCHFPSAGRCRLCWSGWPAGCCGSGAQPWAWRWCRWCAAAAPHRRAWPRLVEKPLPAGFVGPGTWLTGALMACLRQRHSCGEQAWWSADGGWLGAAAIRGSEVWANCMGDWVGIGQGLELAGRARSDTQP